MVRLFIFCCNKTECNEYTLWIFYIFFKYYILQVKTHALPQLVNSITKSERFVSSLPQRQRWVQARAHSVGVVSDAVWLVLGLFVTVPLATYIQYHPESH
jgi:hypothetical protein